MMKISRSGTQRSGPTTESKRPQGKNNQEENKRQHFFHVQFRDEKLNTSFPSVSITPMWKAERLTRGKSKMASTIPPYKKFQQLPCDLCDAYTWRDYMTEREDGIYCEKCAALPPYSDALYNAIVLFQRLFRAHFKAKAEPCYMCLRPCLELHGFHDGRVCKHCYDELALERECPICFNDPCRCEEGDGWCEKCEGEWGCVCVEGAEEVARIYLHRRVCGDHQCDGGCGTLDCGCVDKCKCE